MHTDDLDLNPHRYSPRQILSGGDIIPRQHHFGRNAEHSSGAEPDAANNLRALMAVRSYEAVGGRSWRFYLVVDLVMALVLLNCLMLSVWFLPRQSDSNGLAATEPPRSTFEILASLYRHLASSFPGHVTDFISLTKGEAGACSNGDSSGGCSGTIAHPLPHEAADIATLLLTVAGNIVFYVLLTRGAGLGLTSMAIAPEYFDVRGPATFAQSSPLGGKYDQAHQGENILLTPESSGGNSRRHRSSSGRGQSSSGASAGQKIRPRRREEEREERRGKKRGGGASGGGASRGKVSGGAVSERREEGARGGGRRWRRANGGVGRSDGRKENNQPHGATIEFPSPSQGYF